MKQDKILHYVKNSFEGKPSFVLLMSDGKEYISNGCVFVENTQENKDRLIEEHGCSEELDALFDSPSLDNEDLTDGRCMYRGCTGLTSTSEYPNLTDGSWMYRGCTGLTSTSEYPNLTDGRCMYRGCTGLTSTSEYPNLTDGRCMYEGCTGLTSTSEYPNLTDGRCMYRGCTGLTSTSELGDL